MRGEPITTVLFDLGNVVLDWEPLRLYRQRFSDPDEAQNFVSGVCTLEWHTAHDSGVPFVENRKHLIEKFPHYEDHIVAWDTEWMETFHGYVDGITNILDALLERKVPLFALSNMPGEKWSEMTDHFEYLRVFRDVVISSEEKCIKPDPKIYQITLDRLGVPAENILFIDDRPKNIVAAQAMGMRGHVFESATRLKDELTALGLIG